jgi:hypothetical protein
VTAVFPTRSVGSWANPALLGSEARWRIGLQQAQASKIGVRELAMAGELRWGPLGLGARLVNRRNDRLFDDPELEESTLRVEDDLLALGAGIEVLPRLRIGGSLGALWSTVLGSDGFGYAWQLGIAVSGQACQVGTQWGTRRARMDWSDAGGTAFATSAELGGAVGAGCAFKGVLGDLGAAVAAQQDLARGQDGQQHFRATAELDWSSVFRIYGGVVRRGAEYDAPTLWELGSAVTVGKATLFGGGRFDASRTPGTVYSFGIAVSPAP